MATATYTTYLRDQEANLSTDPRHRAPLVLGDHNLTTVTDKITDITFRPASRGWYIGLCVSLSLLSLLFVSIAFLLLAGVGVWGNNNTVAWGFDIINFVFWVGIGHAGTLISAILFLFRQNWRTSINRFAEAMTIFAVMCAAIFPALHIGRVWLFFWLFPYPNTMAMWPQARSPLWWDVFAVSTYALTSLLFWYMGMIPDFGTLRDKAKSQWAQMIYGTLSLGWTGSCRQWLRFERAYLIMAAIATPLVLSVHSVVSFDFAVAQVPGWHATIFPPYFVAGAVFGGFAMVLTLAIPARQMFGLQDLITTRHLENMCKIMLATGTIVGYAYAVEFFTAWYSGEHFEQFAFLNRALGPYSWAFFVMVFCNVVAPQMLWIRRVRTNPITIFIIAILVNIGMWFERFVIVVTSLHRDFVPASWAMYIPTWVDLGMFAGSFGLFFTMFLLFCRFLPIVAMAELKTVMPQARLTHGPHRFDYQPDPDTPPELRRGGRWT